MKRLLKAIRKSIDLTDIVGIAFILVIIGFLVLLLGMTFNIELICNVGAILIVTLGIFIIVFAIISILKDFKRGILKFIDKVKSNLGD